MPEPDENIFSSSSRDDAQDLIRHRFDELASKAVMRITHSVMKSNSLFFVQLPRRSDQSNRKAALKPRAPRGLLLGSIAFNLLCLAVVLIMTVRAPASSNRDGDHFGSIEQLVTTLPSDDAGILRILIDVNSPTILDTRTEFDAAKDQTRAALRREPFDTNAMRAAMANARRAREKFDQAIVAILTNAAALMSVAGRHALADWPTGNKYPSTKEALN